MANNNRRPQNGGGRRMDFGRNDRIKNFGRAGVSPWQNSGPGGGIPNLMPMGGVPTEATLALANNIINLLQPRQNTVPSLLDMPIRRDFIPSLSRYDRGFVNNRMGNQGNFRRPTNYNRPGERSNNNRNPFRPNDGQRQQNKNSPKKEADSKAKPVKSEEDKDKEETNDNQKEDGKEPQKTRYDDLNPQLLRCHICNKNMWDGRSFENHLSGRAHAIMMQKTAESYALTADTMRQEFKIRDMKRTRKAGQQPARDFFCAMCDMYASDGAIHRSTVGHRKLKKYLHPICSACHKEMPTRIELDEHRLTEEHLRNIQDRHDFTSKPKPEVMVISTLSIEQSYIRDDRQKKRPEVKKEYEYDEEKKDEAQDGEAEISVTIKTEPGEDKEEKKADSESTVLDYKEGDDLTGVTPEQFPNYNTERGVGDSFISEFRCFQCSLCRKLLDSEETAKVHLRTWRHHQLFVRMLQEKTGNKTDKEKQDESSSTVSVPESNKRRRTDDTGNWKRRRTSSERPDHDHDDDTAEEKKEDSILEGDEDESMPLAPEDMEDWEPAGDDANHEEPDEVNGETTTENDQVMEPEPEPEPEPVAEAEEVKEDAVPEAPKASPVKPKPATRGFPRGRGRARGRGKRI